MTPVHFQANHSLSQSSKSMAQPLMLKEMKLNSFVKTYKDLLELAFKKTCPFMIEDCEAKVGSQEILGVQSSLAMEYRMKQGKS